MCLSPDGANAGPKAGSKSDNNAYEQDLQDRDSCNRGVNFRDDVLKHLLWKGPVGAARKQGDDQFVE